MKKSTLFYSILIALLSICIVLVILFKFILKPKPGFNIEKRESLTVTDLNGKESKLFSLIDKEEDTYLLIFSFNDCSSCIFRGIEELKAIKKAGRTCIAIAVHDYYEEIESWSTNQDFSPFFVLKRIDFYEHIKTSLTPVLVKIRNGRIKNAYYIFPN